MLDLGVLVARATLDTAEFDTGYVRTVGKMRGLSDQALKTAAGILRLDESLGSTGKAATDAAAGIDRAAKATVSSSSAEQRATATAERHAAALKQVAGIMTTVAESDQRVQAATLRVTAAQERLTTVQESGTATTRQLAAAQAGLIGAERSLASAQKATYATATRTESGFRRMIGTAAELGLVIGGIEIAKKAIEFVSAGRDLTTALNGVQAAAKATDAQMEQVRAEALRLGRDMSVPKATAVDAADAINDLVRAGMKLPRAMAAARPALLLAAAAQVDTADAARYLGDTLDDFALKASQAEHVANSLAGAATSAGGGLTDMFTALSYAGPYARAVGVDVDSVVASIAELAKSGIQGSRAGTGIARMLQSLANPSLKAQGALHDLGVEAWDTQGRFVGLSSLYDQLHKAQDRMGSDAERFGRDVAQAFGSRAATAVTVFAHRGIEGYNQFAERVKSGDVQKYADLMNRGVSADMDALTKRFTATGIAIWDDLEPAAKSASHWLAYELPKDIGVTMQILDPLIHMVGTGLVGAWRLASGAIGVTARVLGDAGHFLAEHEQLVRVVGTAVLGMWAAYKGYRIVTAAMDAVSVALVNGRANVTRWRAGFSESLTGVQAQTMTTSAVMQAEFAQIEAAALEAAAAQDKAAAQEATAFADMVAASDNATSTMVANAVAQARAAQTAADLSAAAAAEAVAAADTAAAGVATAGEEASIGWGAVMGPIGLAVGALAAVGLGFLHSGSDAAQASQDVQGYTSAIEADSGALGEHLRAQVADNLVKADAYQTALQAGVGQAKLTDAVIQGGQALDGVRAKLLAYARSTVTTTATSHGAIRSYSETGYAAKKLAASLADQNGEILKGARDAHDHAAAMKQSKTAWSGTATAAEGYTGAVVHATSATDRQKDAEQRLKDESKALTGALGAVAGELNHAAAAIAFRQGLSSLTQTMKDNSGALKGHTDAALTDRAAFVSSAQQVVQQAQTMDKNGKTVQQVTGYLRSHIDALKAATIAGGGDKAQVDKLARSLGLVPKDIRSKIELAGMSDALSQVTQIRDALASLPNYVGISVNASGQIGVAGGGHYATGGIVRGPGTGTSDSIPAPRLSNGEFVVNARQTARNRPLLEAINSAAPGFASGGHVSNRSRIARMLAAAGWDKVHIAAAMGNLETESGFDPTNPNRAEGANGLAQWEGSRLPALKAYARAHGEKWTRVGTQVQFMLHELKQRGQYRAFLGTHGVNRAAQYWQSQYEVSDPASLGDRQGNARAIFEALRAGRLARGGHGHGHDGHGGGYTRGGGHEGGGHRPDGHGHDGGGQDPGTGTPLPTRTRYGRGRGNPALWQHIAGMTNVGEIHRVVSGHTRQWMYQGQRYSSKAAAQNAQARDRAAGDPVGDITSHVTGTSYDWKYKGQRYASKRAALNAQTRDEKAAKKPVSVTDRIGAVSGVTKLILADKKTAAKAMGELSRAVNKAFTLKGVKAEIADARDGLKSLRSDLQGMRQYQSGVASTYAGNFDPTQYGTIGGLIGGLGGAAKTDNRLAAQITRLRHEHLNGGYLDQLIGNNQTDLIKMLAGGSQGQINRLNGALGDWRSSLTAIGQTATLNRYGKSIDREQHLIDRQQAHIDHLLTRQGKLTDAIQELAKEITKLTGRPVELTVDGKVIARTVGKHHANGLTHRGRRGNGSG